MKNVYKLFGLIALAAVIGFSFAACDDGGSTVAVTGVTLSDTSIYLSVGESKTLTATVTPANATNKSVVWVTNDANVATVNNGRVTAMSAGSTAIAVATVDGQYTAACTVTVTGGTGGGGSSLSLDGDWQGSSGITIITISGSTGVYKQLDSDDPVLLDAISKGYIGVGKQYLRNLTKTGDLTWTGQIIYVNYNTSSPVATGTSWRDCTITMNANGQTIQITSTGLSGTTTSTWTRTTTASGNRDSRLINGPNDAWINNDPTGRRGMIFKADGTYRTYAEIYSNQFTFTTFTYLWSTSGNNTVTSDNGSGYPLTFSYTVSGNSLTWGLEEYVYTKQTVTVDDR